MSEPTYSPGLEGVIAGISHISHIDLENNVLTYRGYNVQDLCDHSTFEEVAYLLLYGELPNAPQLAEFADWLNRERAVPDVLFDVLRRLPADSEPMDWMKIGVATLSLFDPQAHDNSHDANIAKAVRLTAKLPALLGNGWRVIHGLEPTAADPAHNHAAHFLHLLTGVTPDEFAVKTLNTTLILYAEHGFNASTFTARVTVSTLSDLYSGVVSAIAALKGPLHGGANEEVMRMMLEIGEPANTEAWLRRKMTKTADNPRPRIMGFDIVNISEAINAPKLSSNTPASWHCERARRNGRKWRILWNGSCTTKKACIQIWISRSPRPTT